MNHARQAELGGGSRQLVLSDLIDGWMDGWIGWFIRQKRGGEIGLSVSVSFCRSLWHSIIVAEIG